jgi:hypothetical protein
MQFPIFRIKVAVKLNVYEIIDLRTNLKIYLEYLKTTEKQLLDTQEERGENCVTDTELFDLRDRIEWTKNFLRRVKRNIHSLKQKERKSLKKEC